MAKQTESNFVRNFAAIAGLLTAIVVAVLIVPRLRRDTWEFDNISSIQAAIDRARQESEVDCTKAYTTYEQVLNEASKHPITIETLRQKLDEAQKQRDELSLRVQADLGRKQEARRRAEEERVAEEKRTLDEANELAERLRKAASLDRQKLFMATISAKSAVAQTLPFPNDTSFPEEVAGEAVGPDVYFFNSEVRGKTVFGVEHKVRWNALVIVDGPSVVNTKVIYLRCDSGFQDYDQDALRKLNWKAILEHTFQDDFLQSNFILETQLIFQMLKTIK